MKRFIVYGLLFMVFSLYTVYYVPNTAFAHLAGQPPFFKINGKYARLYPVPLSSLYNFDLPQDHSPENYTVNHSLNFEFDQNRLPAPPEVVAKTKFIWDFGDDSKGEGLKNNHTYNKIGSYILKVYADDSSTPQPQLIESTLLNILPDANYQLPKARIFINGTESKDPLTDILKVNLKDDVSYDAAKSTSPNKLTYYLWDFGDQKSGQGPTQTHHYQADLPQIFVVLRIKDSNGFISDQFVEIQNGPSSGNQQTALITSTKNKSNSILPLILGIVSVLLLLLIFRKIFKGRGGRFGSKT